MSGGFTPRQYAALIEAAKRVYPEAVEAYVRSDHPKHDLAVRYANRLMEGVAAGGLRNDRGEVVFDAEDFLTRYRAGDAGVRARLDAVLNGDGPVPVLAAPLPEDDGLAELRGLTKEQAAARIEQLSRNPEFAALLYADKDGDPIVGEGWKLLSRIAAGETSAGDPVMTGNPVKDAVTNAAPESALAKYEALEKTIAGDANHPFHNPQHADHAAAVAARDAAYDAAIAEASPGASQ